MTDDKKLDLEVALNGVAGNLVPQGPVSQWSPEELRQRREQQLAHALQSEIQDVCGRHGLDPDATISSITSALAIIILLNAKTLETAENVRKDVRKQLKQLINKNWATMQPIKEKLHAQLAEQLRASQNDNPNPAPTRNTTIVDDIESEEPQEDPPSGNVRSDGTG